MSESPTPESSWMAAVQWFRTPSSSTTTTRFEWFEVRNYNDADGNLVDVRAQNVLISHLIVHDFDDPVNTKHRRHLDPVYRRNLEHDR